MKQILLKEELLAGAKLVQKVNVSSPANLLDSTTARCRSLTQGYSRQKGGFGYFGDSSGSTVPALPGCS